MDICRCIILIVNHNGFLLKGGILIISLQWISVRGKAFKISKGAIKNGHLTAFGTHDTKRRQRKHENTT